MWRGILEKSRSKHRRKLPESQQKIDQPSPNPRVLLTGRLYTADEITRSLSKAVMIHISPVDIKSCLEMRLEYCTGPSAMDDELQADIIRIIPEKISERQAGISNIL